MKKKIFIVSIVMAFSFLFTACGSEQLQDVQTSGVNEELSVSDEALDEAMVNIEDDEKNVYPLSIIDQSGREVVIEKKPESLVSSYYITTSALLALGLEDSIKGIESNPEKRPLYQLCNANLFDVANVGSPKEFDLEVCASIEPDLVILPMRAKDMIEPLEQLGITVMIVNPESQDDIINMISLIAKATDCTDRANDLITYIEDKTQYLKEKTADCEKITVYLGGNSSFLSTASKGMYQNDLISLAGGLNVAGTIDDTYWVESSYEQILDWNPEAVVFASDASYTVDEIGIDTYLKDCRAIADKKVYQIPSNIEAWDSPVPSSFLGAVYLASVLHPDLISEKEYEDMVKEYYELFYGFSIEE